jgi:hypothetical protein
MNMVLPSTRDGYRHLVEGLNLTTEAGQRAYATLLTLAEGADAYYSYLEEAAGGAMDMAANAQASITSLWVSITAGHLADAQAALKAAFEAEKANITNSYNAQIKRINESLSTAKTIVSELQGSVDKLRNAKEKMRLEDVASERNLYQTAQADLTRILTQARRGDLSGVKDIDETLNILTGSSADLYSSFVDYQRDYWKTYLSISELEALTGNQLTKEEAMVSLLEGQIDSAKVFYDAQIQAMDSQMNALLNINTGVLSIAEATSALAIAAGIAEKAKEADILSRAVYYSGHVGQFGSKEAYSAGIKEKLMGNIAFTDPVAAETFMRDYPELFATGGSFGGGWRVVGEQGPELEYTGPSNILSNPKSKALVDNVVLISEVRKLREEMRQGNFQIAKNTGKLVRINDRWDSDGLPAERTI